MSSNYPTSPQDHASGWTPPEFAGIRQGRQKRMSSATEPMSSTDPASVGGSGSLGDWPGWRDTGHPAPARSPRLNSLDFWLRLTSPQPPMGSLALLPAEAREHLRQSRLLSEMLLGAIAMILVLAPRSFVGEFNTVLLSVLGVGLLMVAICAILNRYGYIRVGGWLFVLGIASAIASSMVFQTGGLSLANRATFHMLAIPIIVASILLSPRAPLLMWLGCTGFMLFELLFGIHQHDLDVYIAQFGVYGTAITPAASMAFIALISSLAARSVRQAVHEADRTYELERAYLFIVDQKRRLDISITALQETQARAANGDLSARATVASGELAPLAHSLNLMLERLARSRGAEETLGGIEHSIAQLERATYALSQGQLQQPISPQDLGRLTPVGLHLEQLRTGILQVLRYSGGLAEQMAAASKLMLVASQQQQRDRLIQAQTELQRLVEQLQRYLRQFSNG
jgi:HAMP domain-containing protein